MMYSKVRYVIRGLKAEIRNERNPERREHLATMGLYYNDILLHYDCADKRCKVCNKKKCHGSFEIVTAPFTLKDGTKKNFWTQRKVCRTCQNKKRVKAQKARSRQGHFIIAGIQVY